MAPRSEPTPKQKRQTIRQTDTDTNVRCKRINPVEDSKRQISDLKTVGLTFNKQQAVHFATVLLVAAQRWEEINVTGWRFHKRKSDGSYQITVTSRSEADANQDPLPANLGHPWANQEMAPSV